MLQALTQKLGAIHMLWTTPTEVNPKLEMDTMEPTYEHDALSDAAILLECYRDELANTGLVEQYRVLDGLEVYSAKAAEDTIKLLQEMPTDDAEPIGLRDYTILALRRAAQQARLAQAS